MPFFAVIIFVEQTENCPTMADATEHVEELIANEGIGNLVDVSDKQFDSIAAIMQGSFLDASV